MTPTRYVLHVAGLVLLMGCLHLGLFIYQLGAPVRGEYWLYGSSIVKQHLAFRSDSPKILILGGSNALFGIDSQMIESRMGYPTINLALHAGFSLDYVFGEAQSYLNPHDQVILALEYHRYNRKRPYSLWFTNEMMTWKPSYFFSLPMLKQAVFLYSVSWQRLAGGALAQVFHQQSPVFSQRALPTPTQILEAHEQSQRGSSFDPRNTYSPLNINSRGDVRFSIKSLEIQDTDYGLSEPFQSHQEVLDELRAFAAFCQDLNITVWVAWPPSMKNAALDFDNPVVHDYIEKLSQLLTTLHWPILGSPTDYFYEKTLFADTALHLTPEGRTIRTKTIIQHILQSSSISSPSQPQ